MRLLIHLLLFIWFLIVSKYEVGGLNRDYLSKAQTNQWRALFALWVVLSHCTGQTIPALDHIYDVLPFGSFTAVAGFFFFSGYGVQYNYMRFGEDYTKSFPKKRFATLVLPYLFLIGIYWLYNYTADRTYGIKNIVDSFAVGVPMVTSSWYIVVAMLFYCFYYLEMRLFKEKHHLIIWANLILNIVWVFIVKLLGWGYWWYACTLALTIGVFWATYEKQLFSFIQKHFRLVSLVVVIVGLFVCVLYKTYEKMLFEQFLNVSFILVVLLYSMKFEIHSRVLSFLSTISFEIYVIHGLVMGLLLRTGVVMNSSYLFIPLVLLLSVLAAFLLHKLFQLVKVLFLRE